MSQTTFHLAIEDLPHGQDTLNAAIHDSDDWMNDDAAHFAPASREYFQMLKREQRRKVAKLARKFVQHLKSTR